LKSRENSIAEVEVNQPFYSLTPSDFWWKERKSVLSPSTMRFRTEYQLDAVGGISESNTGVFLKCQGSRVEATTVDAGITVFERSRA
jgi:hypothetical protein